MQNYTNFLIYALQLYLNFVKSQLHLIIYKNNLTYACYNKRPVKPSFTGRYGVLD